MFVNNKTCYCDRQDCFAAKMSKKDHSLYYCSCLSDNDFDGEPCPFYKTHDEQKQSLMQVELRKKELAEEKKRKANEGHIRTISGVLFRRKEKHNG